MTFCHLILLENFIFMTSGSRWLSPEMCKVAKWLSVRLTWLLFRWCCSLKWQRVFFISKQLLPHTLADTKCTDKSWQLWCLKIFIAIKMVMALIMGRLGSLTGLWKNCQQKGFGRLSNCQDLIELQEKLKKDNRFLLLFVLEMLKDWHLAGAV